MVHYLLCVAHIALILKHHYPSFWSQTMCCLRPPYLLGPPLVGQPSLPLNYEDHEPPHMVRAHRAVAAGTFLSLIQLLCEAHQGSVYKIGIQVLRKKKKKIHRMCQTQLNSLYFLETTPAPGALELSGRVTAELGKSTKEG